MNEFWMAAQDLDFQPGETPLLASMLLINSSIIINEENKYIASSTLVLDGASRPLSPAMKNGF